MAEERVDVKVMGVYMHQEQEQPPQHFVLFRDDKGRRLPIWMGQYEVWAISFALEAEQVERPMTHDMMLMLLQATDAVMVEACINDLRNETFYATVTLRRADGETRVLDVRPSDAVALALRARSPIFVTEQVMAETSRPD